MSHTLQATPPTGTHTPDPTTEPAQPQQRATDPQQEPGHIENHLLLLWPPGPWRKSPYCHPEDPMPCIRLNMLNLLPPKPLCPPLLAKH